MKLQWTSMYSTSCECKFSFLWDKSPGMQLLIGVVVACLVFKETAQLFCGVAVPFYIPFSNVWVTQFLCVLPSIWQWLCFHFSHSDRYMVASHCSFNFHLPHDVENLFMCLLSSVRPLWWLSFQVFCPFSNLIAFFFVFVFYCWVLGALYIF